MNEIVITYIGYILLAVPLTLWVARTLHKNGRIFLIKNLNGDEDLADSVNHLLVVGFYLVNLGFVSLYLKMSEAVVGVGGIIEALSGKLGIVMLVLGGMHFFNIWLFSRMGRKPDVAARVKPPLYPTFPTAKEKA